MTVMKSLRSWNGNHWARRLSPSIWRSLKSWLRIMADIWPMERWGKFFLWKETTMGLNLLPKSKKSYLLHALLLPLPSFFWGSILDSWLLSTLFYFFFHSYSCPGLTSTLLPAWITWTSWPSKTCLPILPHWRNWATKFWQFLPSRNGWRRDLSPKFREYESNLYQCFKFFSS